ncbi:hypothetical protein SNE26_07585 [Mucilaginibacter sp. cycad4]|uniref:hypothetical protein n=1 Tax=Mucilaginibacter sp. cycad4 TaxID=3342096 RepID=UPI002AAB50F0|nr:hypothetical protein [Mucilaginibacter gossypii]WPV01633.1 hypothetical protein SNE26_07585 [Mucilaginibacter gossypii]
MGYQPQTTRSYSIAENVKQDTIRMQALSTVLKEVSITPPTNWRKYVAPTKKRNVLVPFNLSCHCPVLVKQQTKLRRQDRLR